jgi:hypothetical protein
MARQRVGLTPGPRLLEIDRCDDGRSAVQPSIECLPGALRASGLVNVGFDAEPFEGLAGQPGIDGYCHLLRNPSVRIGAP